MGLLTYVRQEIYANVRA